VLINLLGPNILAAPYADRDELSFLTKDTRRKGLAAVTIHDGLVYEQQEDGFKHVLVESGVVESGDDALIRIAVYVPAVVFAAPSQVKGHSRTDHPFLNLPTGKGRTWS